MKWKNKTDLEKGITCFKLASFLCMPFLIMAYFIGGIDLRISLVISLVCCGFLLFSLGLRNKEKRKNE